MKVRIIALFAVALALIDFLVPFYLLREVESFLGNYLFWSSLSLITIVSGIIHTREWGGSK